MEIFCGGEKGNNLLSPSDVRPRELKKAIVPSMVEQ